ncbi:hypothetical protein ACA910_014893 [Epithemia clementina (nom. ined.)]
MDDDEANNDETTTTTTGSATKNNNDPQCHHLQHGFSVILNVLSPSTAQALQQYILQQKCIFDNDDNQGRLYGRTTRTGSWRSGRYDLLQVVEQVIGPNPAVVELMAITFTYGAANQQYHNDIIASTLGPNPNIVKQLLS